MNTINPAYDNTQAIEAAIVGRRIVAIDRTPDTEASDWEDWQYGDRATITLDDGTVLVLDGHDGGCACSAGCYELGHLATLAEVDNVITAVEFEAAPAGDDSDCSTCGRPGCWEVGHETPDEGHYRRFVFADNRKVNLATFEGSDGNGYYGTGYYVRIAKP